MPSILIIDDSAFARNIIHRILRETDYQISEAASGELALQAVLVQTPDLVTLDLLMPGMSGLETLKKLRAICPKTKVIVISADIQTATREELISAGAEAFINKPVSHPDLLETAARLLGQVK